MPGILPEPRHRAQNRFAAERKSPGPATPVCGERKSTASAQPVGARLPANAVYRRDPCGRHTAFASKLTPTVDRRRIRKSRARANKWVANAKSNGWAEPVGAGLLANAVYQAKSMAQADCIRGQARSYSGSALAGISASCAKPVGAGLLANAVYQAKSMAQADCIRGQARSYSGSALAGISASCAKPVGAGLLANAVGRYMFRRGSALAAYAPNRTQQGAWRWRTCSC